MTSEPDSRIVVLNASPEAIERYRNLRRDGVPRHEANFMAAGAAAATESADVYILPPCYTIADLRRELTNPVSAPKPSALKSIINHLLDGEVPITYNGTMSWSELDFDGCPMYRGPHLTDDEVSALKWCQS